MQGNGVMIRDRMWAAIAAGFLMVSCSQQSAPPRGTKSDESDQKTTKLGLMNSVATPEEVEAAKRAELAVGTVLKDPESAKYRDVIVSLSQHCVTGEVQSARGINGYAGYQTFVMTNDRLRMSENDGAAMDESTKCMKANSAEIQAQTAAILPNPTATQDKPKVVQATGVRETHLRKRSRHSHRIHRTRSRHHAHRQV
jgi:hypothetical protein